MFKYVDVLIFQETQVLVGETSHLKIPGYSIVDYRGHHKHGLAKYNNQHMEETNMVSSWKCTLDWCSYRKPHNLQRLQTTPGKVI